MHVTHKILLGGDIMQMSEERLQNIKRKILEAIDRKLEVILREEFQLGNSDITTLVRRFVSEFCIIKNGSEVSSKELYEAFDKWSRNNNYGAFSHISFSQTIERQRYLGVRRVRKQQGSFWNGIRLNNESGDINV